MIVQKIRIAHFATYQLWFQDELVQGYLETPPDAAWLNYILKEEGVLDNYFFVKN